MAGRHVLLERHDLEKLWKQFDDVFIGIKDKEKYNDWRSTRLGKAYHSVAIYTYKYMDKTTYTMEHTVSKLTYYNGLYCGSIFFKEKYHDEVLAKVDVAFDIDKQRLAFSHLAYPTITEDARMTALTTYQKHAEEFWYYVEKHLL